MNMRDETEFQNWQKEMKKAQKKPFYNWMGRKLDDWSKDTTLRPKL